MVMVGIASVEVFLLLLLAVFVVVVVIVVVVVVVYLPKGEVAGAPKLNAPGTCCCAN